MFSWLRSRNVFWWVIIAFCFTCICFVVISAVLTNAQSVQFEWLLKLRSQLETIGWMPVFQAVGELMQDDALYAISVGLLFSLLSTGLIFVFKISSIRKVAIQAIAYGYFENFLIRLVKHCTANYPHYRIVLVRPTFQLVEYPDVYMEDIKARLRALGFETVKEMTDENFVRNALFVQRKDNPPIPLFIDIPTTLKTLRKILELEADMPAGKIVEHRWWRTRFAQLCREFEKSIGQVLPTNSWGNIVFIDSQNTAKFEAQLMAEIEKLESLLRAENNRS